MIYKVISNLKTGDKTYVAGDEIEFEEEKAKSLVEDGILEEVKTEEKPVPPVEPEEKTEKRGRKKRK